MSKLILTIVVRHPDTDAPVALIEGTELPEWAEGLVHPDNLVEVPAPVDAGDPGQAPVDAGDPGQAPVAPETPAKPAK